MFDEVVKTVKELIKALHANTEALKAHEIALTDCSGNIVDLSKDILTLIDTMEKKS